MMYCRQWSEIARWWQEGEVIHQINNRYCGNLPSVGATAQQLTGGRDGCKEISAEPERKAALTTVFVGAPAPIRRQGGSRAYALAVEVTLCQLPFERGACVPSRCLYFPIAKFATPEGVPDEWVEMQGACLPSLSVIAAPPAEWSQGCILLMHKVMQEAGPTKKKEGTHNHRKKKKVKNTKKPQRAPKGPK